MRTERDNSPITAASLFRTPKNVAIILFLYVFLVLFKVCLTSIIKINAATIGSFDFHCRAIELLHATRELLKVREL
jgi:hypothetical protein